MEQQQHTTPTDHNPNKPEFITVAMAAHELPKALEARGKEWITYGDFNKFYYELLEMYQKSANHGAIINGKVDYITGGGWTYNKSGLTVTKQAEAQLFLAQPWGTDTLDEFARKISYDMEIIGGVTFLVKAPKGEGIPTIEHYPISDVRTNKDLSKFYCTSQWYTVNPNGTLKENKTPENADDWNVYNPYDPSTLKKDGTQLYYKRIYIPKITGFNVYPVPSYIAGLQDIRTDILLTDFHHTNVEQGFVGTHYIQFLNGNPTPEVKRQIEEAFQKKHGTATGSRLIFGFFDGPDRQAKIDTLTSSDADKQYEYLEKRVEQRIFTIHQVTSPMLFGIKTEGQLGGRTELELMNELFQSRYVALRQRIINGIVNQLSSDFGIGVEFRLKRHDPIGLDWFGNDKLYNLLSEEQKKEKAGIEMPAIVKSAQQFSQLKEDDKAEAALILFSSAGITSDKFDELFSSELNTTDILSVRASESVLMRMEFADKKLSPLQRSVLDLLKKDPLMPKEEIAKVTKATAAQVQKAITWLLESEMLEYGKAKSGEDKIPEYTITKRGEDILSSQGAKTEKIEVRYKYEVKAGFGKAIIETTRDFCRKLIELNRLYTREEIEAITDQVGYNVWEMRGGWYTKPGTTVHVPHCRHVWKQKVVRVKE